MKEQLLKVCIFYPSSFYEGLFPVDGIWLIFSFHLTPSARVPELPIRRRSLAPPGSRTEPSRSRSCRWQRVGTQIRSRRGSEARSGRSSTRK